MATRTVTPGGEVNFYKEECVAHFTGVSRKGLAAVAARIEGQAKINIVANDQVDTAFMLNSVYHIGVKGSSYGQANSSGQYTNKEGQQVKRQMAPEAQLPPGYDALVAVGANYAIFQEMMKSFLYKALVDVAAEAGGIIEAIAKGES
ncbi:MAG: hypothetical protein H6658_02090 [Ardenticatenaceae bacterium]|nr:hypothetical protein [Ardenticatenaceae bacterium]